ncbi:unnamed protein product, partial [Prunus brigantina]
LSLSTQSLLPKPDLQPSSSLDLALSATTTLPQSFYRSLSVAGSRSLSHSRSLSVAPSLDSSVARCIINKRARWVNNVTLRKCLHDTIGRMKRAVEKGNVIASAVGDRHFWSSCLGHPCLQLFWKIQSGNMVAIVDVADITHAVVAYCCFWRRKDEVNFLSIVRFVYHICFQS